MVERLSIADDTLAAYTEAMDRLEAAQTDEALLPVYVVVPSASEFIGGVVVAHTADDAAHIRATIQHELTEGRY